MVVLLLKYSVCSTGHVLPELRSAPEMRFLVMFGRHLCREKVIKNVFLVSENKLKTIIETGHQDCKEGLFE